MSKPQWLRELLESHGDVSELKTGLIRLYHENLMLQHQLVQRTNEINDMNFELNQKINNLKYKINEMSWDKRLLDDIRACNTFRIRVEGLETLSGDNELIRESRFPIYKMIFKAMVEIYVLERKMGTDSETLDTTGEYCEIFMERLTRKERWRILIMWFFFETLHISCQMYDTNDFRDDNASTEEKTRNNLLRNLYNLIREESDKFKKDCNSLENSMMFEGLRLVKKQFIKKFEPKSGHIELVMYKIEHTAQAMQDGFEKCIEKMNAVQELTQTPSECLEDYQAILCADYMVVNRITIRMCFDVIKSLWDRDTDKNVEENDSGLHQ